jgi:hypothetical protein
MCNGAPIFGGTGGIMVMAVGSLACGFGSLTPRFRFSH